MSPRTTTAAGRAIAWVIRRRWWVIAAWIAGAAAFAPAAQRAEQTLEVSARDDASESARADVMLRERFASPFSRYAVLVARGVPSPEDSAGIEIVREIVAHIRAVPGVTGTLSYLDAYDPLFLSPAGDGTFVIVGIDPGPGAQPDILIPRLRAATAGLPAVIAAHHPGAVARLEWTGDVALNHDIRITSAAEVERAEKQVLPLTLVTLVIAFGAIAAAFLPIAVAMIAIVAATGAAVHAAGVMSLSILLQNVVTMLGLGLGIDYALLMVSRFREELARGLTAENAAAAAMSEAGHTIILSAATVLIGFGALLVIPLNELRGVAVGGGLVVIAAAATAVVPLPALLAALGARVNLGTVRRAAATASGGDRWRRWALAVCRRPVTVMIVGSAPLLFLSWQATRMETSLPRSNWLPPSMESARALTALEDMGRAGVVQALRIVVELPEGRSVIGPDGWMAVRRVSRDLAADPRIERVQSLQLLIDEDSLSMNALGMLPGRVVAGFVSEDQRAAALEVMPRSELDFTQLTELVRELRARDSEAIAGMPGTRMLIGGLPAFNADYEDAIAGRLVTVVALVIGVSLVALFVGFRSVMVAFKAVLLNLLSVGAALGAVVLVFQDGHAAALFGVDAAMGSLFPALPVLVFCAVFGLSMDYEVFLVARVAEARRAGANEEEAIAQGLARTGGVITSAAAIMIIVFGAFTLGDFLMIKVLGFALAAAVLFDATIVRIAVGPALLRLAGRWNWWPGR